MLGSWSDKKQGLAVTPAPVNLTVGGKIVSASQKNSVDASSTATLLEKVGRMKCGDEH